MTTPYEVWLSMAPSDVKAKIVTLRLRGLVLNHETGMIRDPDHPGLVFRLIRVRGPVEVGNPVTWAGKRGSCSGHAYESGQAGDLILVVLDEGVHSYRAYL